MRKSVVFSALCLVFLFTEPSLAQKARAGISDRSGSGDLIERVTYDLGVSAGSYGEHSYTELNLGLNLFFSEYVSWRNALFGRFVSGDDSFYGLDSSVRGTYDLRGDVGGFTAFAGPGYRFASQGKSVPFAEAGLVLHLGGISLGGGVKSLFNSAIESGAANDTQYFIILAGGGSL